MYSLIINALYSVSKLLFPKFKVMDDFQTIRRIKEDKCSCVRFGDGEIDIIRTEGKIGEGYQIGSEQLSRELKKILNLNPQNKIIICIPVFFLLTYVGHPTKKNLVFIGRSIFVEIFFHYVICLGQVGCMVPRKSLAHILTDEIFLKVRKFLMSGRKFFATGRS